MQITNFGHMRVSLPVNESNKVGGGDKPTGGKVVDLPRVKRGGGEKALEQLNSLYLQNQTKLLGKSIVFAHERATVFASAIKLAGGDASVINELIKQYESKGLSELKSNDIKVLNRTVYQELQKQFGIKNKNDAQIKAKEIFTKHLNNKPWDTITKAIEHGGKSYRFELTPASQMKIGRNDIFENKYNGKGICCASTTETKHITNMWISKVTSDNGEELFSGIRHGVLSPYGLEKNTRERESAAFSKARELATAALFSKPELVNRALAGETVNLRMVSTALLTPTKVAGGEDVMLKDQIKALRRLISSKEQPTELKIEDENGVLKSVKVNLEILPFNCGVNELALKLGLGWKAVDKLNNASIETLLGNDFLSKGVVGGWAGEHTKLNPHKQKDILTLAGQIREIMINDLHKNDGGEPYKLSQRISMLAYEIGAVPCWNCKSGKDRTGMHDAEVKREVIMKHQSGEYSKVNGKLSKEDQVLFGEILINSGNMEIQENNTGVPGSKVIKKLPMSSLDLSYSKRIGDNKIWDMVKGFSSFV
ncbi:type III secretion system effector inositol phosphate phosphatase [Escherichia coli]|nr:type III secretion system effector inositol phosphate phosphatase [Escherichia coli]EGF7412938.1 type III secretion system effector inositol phosphate phosphatase [Escherichia coli]EGF7453509.1 type III secretion system effector inositol phosphate phosphatase [Escherichia coli]